MAKDGLPSALVSVFEKALSVSRQERYAAAWVFARELRIGLGLIPAEEPDPSPADGDGRSIVTLDQLVRVMIDEARLSMGSDTPGDPLGRTAEAERPGAVSINRDASRRTLHADEAVAGVAGAGVGADSQHTALSGQLVQEIGRAHV